MSIGERQIGGKVLHITTKHIIRTLLAHSQAETMMIKCLAIFVAWRRKQNYPLTVDFCLVFCLSLMDGPHTLRLQGRAATLTDREYFTSFQPYSSIWNTKHTLKISPPWSPSDIQRPEEICLGPRRYHPWPSIPKWYMMGISIFHNYCPLSTANSLSAQISSQQGKEAFKAVWFFPRSDRMLHIKEISM